MLQKVPGSEVQIHYIKLDEHLAPAIRAPNGMFVNSPEFTISADASDPSSRKQVFDAVNKRLVDLIQKTFDEALLIQRDGVDKIIVTFRYGAYVESSLQLKKNNDGTEEWSGRYSITAVPVFPVEPVIRITMD